MYNLFKWLINYHSSCFSLTINRSRCSVKEKWIFLTGIVLAAILSATLSQAKSQTGSNKTLDIHDRIRVLPKNIVYEVWVDNLSKVERGKEKLWIESIESFLGGKYKNSFDLNKRLVEKLGSLNSDHVHRAAYILTRISELKNAKFSLFNGLIHKNKQIRANSASLLGFLKPRDRNIIRRLESNLKDENSIVRRSAALSLGNIRPYDHTLTISLNYVIESDPNKEVRRAARWANTRIIQVLNFKKYISYIDTDKPSEFELANDIVSGAGPVAIPVLVKIIKDESESIRKRSNAIAVLMDIQPVTNLTIQEFKYILHNKDFDSIKSIIITVMIRKLILSEDLISSFEELLYHDDYLVRAYAAGALFMIRSTPKHIEPKLREMIGDSNYLIERLNAMLVLKHISDLDKETIETLKHLAKSDKDEGVRYIAKEVLKDPKHIVLRTRPLFSSDLPDQP